MSSAQTSVRIAPAFRARARRSSTAAPSRAATGGGVPHSLSGAAIIAATQPVPDNFDLSADPATPLPVLLIHGTKDPLVPYDGGMASLWGFRPRGLGRSAPETAEY